MTIIRRDGSVRSMNSPVWDNRFQVRDFGLYRGVVRGVVYTDDPNNDSGGGTANEVVYQVMLIGGDRDGQMFDNARLIQGLGGSENFDELVLKATEGASGLDVSSIAAVADPSIANTRQFNGDSVYIQFLNGSPTMPVIIGMARHQMAEPEATKAQGQRRRRKFNGVFSHIDADGQYFWSKDNGALSPVVAPNPRNPLYPFFNQFAVIPGQEQAVKISLDNQYNWKMEYLTGLSVSVAGLTDEFAFRTAAGASVVVNGTTDSLAVATTVGTAFKVDGVSDSLALTTAAGTSLTVSGASGIAAKTAAGDQILLAGSSGFLASTSTGSSINLTTGGTVVLASSQGASLILGAGGTIKLGSAAGDVVAILKDLAQALSTELPSGFGAPLTNLSKYVELLAKLTVLAGG